jgi:hypothetical protein
VRAYISHFKLYISQFKLQRLWTRLTLHVPLAMQHEMCLISTVEKDHNPYISTDIHGGKSWFKSSEPMSA